MEKDKKYLRLLQEKFPTKVAVYTELINLEAIQNLPKGTELFLSDIHGAAENFEHILRTGAGNVREKIEKFYGDQWTEKEKDSFSLLISYPERVLSHSEFTSEKTNEWYSQTMIHLVDFMRFVAIKYSRSKVRKALPEAFTYIIEELLYTDYSDSKKSLYYYNILNRLIELKQADAFIIEMSTTIQRLVIDHLHLVGDIFDRSSGENHVMEKLMAHHSVDIQWGNHDVLWMGAIAGSKVNLITLLRISARYGYLFELEEHYGINLRPLFLYADETYQSHQTFYPKANQQPTGYKEESEELLAKVHHALAIMQFKLEGQLIHRRPEFKMTDRSLLERIDRDNQTVDIDGIAYDLIDFPYNQIDWTDPNRLFPEEEYIIRTLLKSFQESEKMRRYGTFLLEKGRMYLIYNDHLLFHGCVPITDEGEFLPFECEGEEIKGRKLLDTFEKHIRQAAQDPHSHHDYSTDLMWYAWSGPVSPLFGREKMTTFERYYIKESNTHVEKRNAYFDMRNKESFVNRLLNEFDLDDEQSRIINGHTPVKAKAGESPVKANGKLFVIDGGINKAYQAATGIAGYSLLNNSYGFQLVTHHPFVSIHHLFEKGKDETSVKEMIDGKKERKLIKHTTIGKSIQSQIDDLQALFNDMDSKD